MDSYDAMSDGAIQAVIRANEYRAGQCNENPEFRIGFSPSQLEALLYALQFVSAHGASMEVDTPEEGSTLANWAEFEASSIAQSLDVEWV